MAALICPRGHDDPGTGSMCQVCGEFLRKAAPAAPPVPPPPVRSGHDGTGATSPRHCAEAGCGLDLDEDGSCPVHALLAPGEDVTLPAGTPPREEGDREPERHAGPRTAHGAARTAGEPLAVVFPWGAHPLESSPLVVGRSRREAPVVAPRLRELAQWAGTDFGNVSGVHALLWTDGSGAWIRHLSGTNETWLNGRPLEGERPYRLRPGDTLRFAADLRAHIATADRP